MNDQSQPTPENPTLGRSAGYHLDENGNVTGLWFTMNVDYFVEFTDVAITDPDQLPKRRPRND